MTNINPALSVGDTLKTAWQKVYGAKASIWAAVIIAQIVFTVLMTVSNVVSSVVPMFGVVLTVVSALIYILMQLGIYYIGIQRARNHTVEYNQMFHAVNFNYGLQVIGLLLVQSIVLLGPSILAGIASYIVNQQMPGILAALFYIASALLGTYLLLSMSLSLGYVLTEQTNPIKAVKRSFAMTKTHLIELFAIFVIFIVIYFLLSLPLLLGLIWGVPFGYVLYGEIFNRIAHPIPAERIQNENVVMNPTKI